MEESGAGYRVERDPVGEKRVPADALYGVQTARALENFRISALRIHPLFVVAYAEIKKAAAQANVKTGALDRDVADAIVKAADEVIEGRWSDQFRLDVFQAGAGTSYNMNVNEVIANRALELLGARRGDYARVNPNDDVNKGQSTNDTMPTAMRVTSVRLLRELTTTLDQLANSFSFASKAPTSESTAAPSSRISRMQVMRIAVGITSLVDCDLLTWSFGLIRA